MKKIFYLAFLSSLISVASGQGIGINTTNSPAHSSAMLDVQSINKGVLIPRITANQRLAIASPATGLLIFDIDSAHLFMYTNGWKSIKTVTDLGEIIKGVNIGDILTWNGSKWIVSSSTASSVYKYFYRDKDGDGYGDKFQPVLGISALEGFVENNKDCNDNIAAIHPGVIEVCNGVDDDCDGQVDEGLNCNNTTDEDSDGYSIMQGDCDDHNSAIHPGATEVCNGKDDDCDGQIDEGLNCATDSDADGYTINGGDCNDNNPSIHPLATEVCNGVDDDCDGQVDEGLDCNNTTDEDSDGYSIMQGDCDDHNSAIHPGATEVCNGKDDDCDGQIDEGLICSNNTMPILRIKYLLNSITTSRKKTVKEMKLETGFEHLSHFNRIFKEKNQLYPFQYSRWYTLTLGLTAMR